MFGFLKKPNYHNSKPHLLLLSKFLHPSYKNDFYQDCWKDVLGENSKDVIDSLEKMRWIIKASREEKIERLYTVSELKTYLKNAQLSVTGKKSVLIERIIEANLTEIISKIDKEDICVCSDEGRRIASNFIEIEQAKRDVADTQTLQLLRERKFVDAASVMLEYEKGQVFARGIGVDWDNQTPSVHQNMLNLIFTSEPGILRDIEEIEMEPLRVVAGMMYLWGKKWSKTWVSNDFALHHHFDIETASRMLLFYSTNKQNLARYKADDIIKKVEILTTDNSCNECQKFNGKKFSLDRVPELPHEKCSHEMGCRCTYIPITESYEEIIRKFTPPPTEYPLAR
jgi:hypothetical protein